jgi:hypothetical protein
MVFSLFRSIVTAAELWMALHDVRRPPSVEEVHARIGATPALVVFYAERHEVPISEAFALASHESNFRDWRVSSAGCIGTLQIQPRYYCREPGSCDTLAARIEQGLRVWKRRRSESSSVREAARAYARGASAARNNPSAGAAYADSFLRIERRLHLQLTSATLSAPAPCVASFCRPSHTLRSLTRATRFLASPSLRFSSPSVLLLAHAD